jgi:hypothetical protein
VREVESLALGDERREPRPRRRLCGIREQVHDDRAALDGLLNGEQRLSRHLSSPRKKREETKVSAHCYGGERDLVRTHPTIFQCLFPTLAVLANADDDVKAIVARVEALSVALRAIADEGKRIIFEVVL